tara:strand:- start:2130 stop:5306 length:3177 start_codon:yes stop_codon:yes gene_type:complete
MSVFKKIDPADITITPFNVYKDYTINSTNYSSSYGVQILQGNYYTHSFGDPIKGIPIAQELTNANKTYKSVIYDSVNHLYYQRTDKPSENFGGNNPEKENRFLGEKAYVISVPSTVFDLRIKSGSVKFTDHYIQRLPLDREKNLINQPYNVSSSLFNTPFQSPTVYNTAPILANQYQFETTASRHTDTQDNQDLQKARPTAAEGYTIQGKYNSSAGSITGTGSLNLIVRGVDTIDGIPYNVGNGLVLRKGGTFNGLTNTDWWSNVGQATGENSRHGMPAYTVTMWVKPPDFNKMPGAVTGAPGQSTILTRDKNSYFELNMLTSSYSASSENPKGLLPLQMFWGATGSNCTTAVHADAVSNGFALATGSWNFVSVMQEFWPDCYYGSSGSRLLEEPPWGHSAAKTTVRIYRPDPNSTTGFTYIEEIGYATKSIESTFPFSQTEFRVTASNQYNRNMFIGASGSVAVGANSNNPTSKTPYMAFTGSIDEVRFYESVLTDTHIARLWKTPSLRLDTISPLTASFNIVDDGYGNLVDKTIPTGSFATKSALVGYYGFNELYTVKNKISSSGDQFLHYGSGKTPIKDFSTYQNNAVSDKVCFKEGIAAFAQSGSNRNASAINFYQSDLKSGIRAQFNNSGSIKIPHMNKLNLNSEEGFAISFWIKIPENQIPGVNTLTGTIPWNFSGGSVVSDDTQDYISDQGHHSTYYWTSGSPAGRDYVTLITKSGLGTKTLQNAATGEYFDQLIQGNEMKNDYPYHIELKNTSREKDGKLFEPGLGTPLGAQLNTLVFRKKSGQRTLTVESNRALTPLVDHHIVIQKQGQGIQMWIDGVLDRTAADTIVDCTDNISDVFLGDNGTAWVTGSRAHKEIVSSFIPPENPFSGSLDELRFYDTSLSKNEIWSLYDNNYDNGTAYQENVVGNVFYEHGIIALTNTNFPRYWSGSLHTGTANVGNDSTALFSDNYRLQLKNTRELYEQSIKCHTKASDFNLTTNPTARKTIIGNCSEILSNQELADFAKDPVFNPYVTTIGLYDEYGRLLGIGKLARPIQKLKNVDMTFIIKFDI